MPMATYTARPMTEMPPNVGAPSGILVRIAPLAASRAVRLGSPKRVSMNFSTAVWSATVCETYPGLVNGETTMSGTRKP